MSRVILEGVEGAEEQLGRRVEPYQHGTVQKYRIEQYEHEDARYEAIEDARDHERPADVPAACAHEIHDSYLVAGGVDGETDGVEHDKQRADSEEYGLCYAVLLRGVDNLSQTVDSGFVLIEVHFVYGSARPHLRILLCLQVFGDALILARLLRPYLERGAERIGAELIERLKRQLVVLVTGAEISQSLLTADVRDRGDLGQGVERLFYLLYLLLRRVRPEVDGDVDFVGEVLERRGHGRIRYHDVHEHERHNRHHENRGERNESVADEADEPVPCYPLYCCPKWHIK